MPSTSSFMKNFDSSVFKSRMKFIAYPSYSATFMSVIVYVPGKCSLCHFSNKSIKKPGLSVIDCSL